MLIINIFNLLDKYSVDQNQSERNDEQDVREVEDKLAHIVLCAESLGIPVSNADLKYPTFQTYQNLGSDLLKS